MMVLLFFVYVITNLIHHIYHTWKYALIAKGKSTPPTKLAFFCIYYHYLLLYQEEWLDLVNNIKTPYLVKQEYSPTLLRSFSAALISALIVLSNLFNSLGFFFLAERKKRDVFGFYCLELLFKNNGLQGARNSALISNAQLQEQVPLSHILIAPQRV